MSAHADRPSTAPTGAALRVAGTIRVPGDKSISHRALILAALSDGASRVRDILPSADVHATAGVLRALGVEIPPLGRDITIIGHGAESLRTPAIDLDCGNSGTTTRLMAGVVAGRPGLAARFVGDASLSRRPMRRVTDPLTAMGARCETEAGDGLPMRIVGAALRPITWDNPKASAQIKSAVLLAGVSSGCEAAVREPLRSRDHTERMLRARGVAVETRGELVVLPAASHLHAVEQQVPGDPSSAAFFVALALLADGGSLRLDGVGLNPTRTGGIAILARMGAEVVVLGEHENGGEPVGTLHVAPGARRATTVEPHEVPAAIDELPLVACVAARCDGETRITGAAELRVKESDRIAAVVQNLQALGVDAEERPDGLVVRGGDAPLRGHVVTHGDHRLAMAFGILAAEPRNAITIDDPDCVSVSYPTFWDDLRAVTSVVTSAVTSAVTSVGGGEAAPEARGETDREAASTTPGTAATTVAPTPTVPDTVVRPSDRLVIAIDGPAASGKSSTAQWVAEQLGVRHVDSGAFYRALTWIALGTGDPPPTWTAALVLAGSDRISLGLTERSVVPRVDGADVDVALRGGEVTAEVSRVARMPAVRDWVNQQVRRAGAASDVVVDGRDIGTAVFPDASLKVYLVADPWERARRRLVQRLGRRPADDEIAAEVEALVARDARDARQSVPAADAVTIDTTTLTQAEQVERIVALARAVRAG